MALKLAAVKLKLKVMYFPSAPAAPSMGCTARWSGKDAAAGVGSTTRERWAVCRLLCGANALALFNSSTRVSAPSLVGC